MLTLEMLLVDELLSNELYISTFLLIFFENLTRKVGKVGHTLNWNRRLHPCNSISGINTIERGVYRPLSIDFLKNLTLLGQDGF